jgi:P-type Ca2+ transporter type 2C
MSYFFKAVDLTIDESSFTGETDPSVKHTDRIPSEISLKNILQRRNISFMGTLVKNGHGKVIIRFETK